MTKLVFPSGLSVQRAKLRAKELVKSHKFDSLSKAQDSIALEEMGVPWALAMPQVIEVSTIVDKQGYLITSADIKRIMTLEPLLTHFGFQHSDSHSEAFYKWHRYDSKLEYLQQFKKNRNYLRNAVEECQRCCVYLQYMDKLKAVRYRLGSYGLKHSVEKYHEHRGLRHGDAYVSNGAFICAAIHMGFQVIRKGPDSPNAWIGGSVSSDIILWERLLEEGGALSRRDKSRLEKIKQKIGLLAN